MVNKFNKLNFHSDPIPALMVAMPEQNPHQITDMADAAAQELGPRIRRARRRRALTLDQMAAASGVSKGMLSQVEAGKSTPTITLLYRIALALDLPPSELVEDRFRASHLEVVRAGRPDRRYQTHQNCAGVKLTPPWLDQDLEFYRFDLPVGGALKSQPHAPHTHEITSVARGKIKVVSAGEEAVLAVGDSARYAADVPHSLINAGREPAVIYVVANYRTEL